MGERIQLQSLKKEKLQTTNPRFAKPERPPTKVEIDRKNYLY